jgi:hypothetical protein
MLNPRTVNV